MYQVFIDGKEGTTGLQIFERLQVRNDIEILQIDSQKRKIEAEKREVIREADLVILCLPDEISKKLFKQMQICQLSLSTQAQHLELI